VHFQSTIVASVSEQLVSEELIALLVTILGFVSLLFSCSAGKLGF